MRPIEPVGRPGAEVPALAAVERRAPDEERRRERERRRAAARASAPEPAAETATDLAGEHVDVRA